MSRDRRGGGGGIGGGICEDDGPMDDGVLEELIVDDSSKESKMNLPPRYRFRDLLLGDFAFNDDGER